MEEKTIRWGILGLGKIAGKFATDLLTVDGSKLYAVASRSLEKAKAFQKEFGAKMAHGSYADLANDPEVDVIYIATPHSRHKEDSLMCIATGKAVLCEKPFAINSNQVNAMIAFAKAKKGLLMEAMWTRMMPSFLFVQDEIDSGKYGAIQTITADFCFKSPFDTESRLFDKNLGGGALLDVGIYPVFLALALLGKPNEISAKAKMGRTNVDEETNVTFNYINEAKAFLKSSIIAQSPTTATILCEKGLIYMHPRFHNTDKVTTILEGVKTVHDFCRKTKGYNFEIGHMASLLRQGKTESDLMTFELSRLLIETLDTIREEIGLTYHED